MHHQTIMDACKRANAAGVQNLLGGNHVEAAFSFTEALKVVKVVLDREYSEEPSQSQSSSIQGSSYPVVVVAVPQEKTKHHISSSPFEQVLVSADIEARQQERSRFVYTSPLQITGNAEFSSREAAIGVSIAIMFNLALSHHLRALYDEESTPENRLFFLQQALALYEVAYTLLMQEGVEVLSIETTLAIINNLGQIHQAMSNQEKAARCFRHLLSTIVFVQSYGETVDSTEVFVQNVSHLILRELVAPAA